MDYAGCVAFIVIQYHQSMPDAWNMTYREFCLLEDVRNNLRGLQKQTTTYDSSRLTGLEAHLKNIGAL